MIGYYKQAILKASALLNKVHKDPDDLDCLLDLQSFLVQKIKQAEKKISGHKAEIKKLQKTLKKERLSKENAKEVKARISRIKERIEQYRYVLFVWKCFGDGIANIYFDKYALKHTLYKTEDYMPKEEAGFITGKKGFRMEWAIIKASIEHNTAAILCDITNVIRHGDVCLALHSDPFVIEVKSSKNTNRRTDRQLHNLGQLHDFYINDGSNDFRGQKNVRRREFSIPEINYTKHLQECIKQSYKKGTASISPEKGLHYISIYKKYKKDCFEGIVNKSSMIFMLNSTKMERAWLPYYPFTLSIQDPEHLYDFIYGNIYLLVVIDLSVLKAHIKNKNLHPVILMDNEPWFLQISVDPKELRQGVFRVSSDIFARVSHDFQSLKWFADIQSEFSKMRPDDVETIDLTATDIPDDWYGLSDDF